VGWAAAVAQEGTASAAQPGRPQARRLQRACLVLLGHRCGKAHCWAGLTRVTPSSCFMCGSLCAAGAAAGGARVQARGAAAAAGARAGELRLVEQSAGGGRGGAQAKVGVLVEPRHPRHHRQGGATLVWRAALVPPQLCAHHHPHPQSRVCDAG